MYELWVLPVCVCVFVCVSVCVFSEGSQTLARLSLQGLAWRTLGLFGLSRDSAWEAQTPYSHTHTHTHTHTQRGYSNVEFLVLQKMKGFYCRPKTVLFELGGVFLEWLSGYDWSAAGCFITIIVFFSVRVMTKQTASLVLFCFEAPPLFFCNTSWNWLLGKKPVFRSTISNCLYYLGLLTCQYCDSLSPELHSISICFFAVRVNTNRTTQYSSIDTAWMSHIFGVINKPSVGLGVDARLGVISFMMWFRDDVDYLIILRLIDCFMAQSNAQRSQSCNFCLCPVLMEEQSDASISDIYIFSQLLEQFVMMQCVHE